MREFWNTIRPLCWLAVILICFGLWLLGCVPAQQSGAAAPVYNITDNRVITLVGDSNAAPVSVAAAPETRQTAEPEVSLRAEQTNSNWGWIGYLLSLALGSLLGLWAKKKGWI